VVATSAAAFGDAIGVPQRPVLIVERYQLARRVGAGRTAGVNQQQGQQAARLGFGGQQPVQDAGQPDGFFGEVGPQELLAGAGGVPFGEDQADDAQYRGQAPGQLAAPGNLEGARHLRGGQPGQAPQRQRGLGLG
jgi:hypothetical protein